jgi:hypothetical protein
MGNSGQLSFSSGGYAYEPPGSAEALAGVRIPIWSTKCLGAQWIGRAPSTPLIEADLRPAGPERLAGTVANRTGMTLHDTIVAINRHVYILGTLAPGQSVQVELSPDRQLSGHLLQASPGRVNPTPWNNQGPLIDRADLLLDLMFHDSEATSTAEAPLQSNVLHNLDLTGLLAIDRPMLVARIDRPASRLVIENAPSAPQVEQTTLLRVILPLKKADDDSK